MTDLWSWFIALLPQVIGAAVLLLAGLWLARWVERVLTRLFDQHRLLDLTFRGVLTTLVRYSILLLAVIAALQQLQTTSVLAAIGAMQSRMIEVKVPKKKGERCSTSPRAPFGSRGSGRGRPQDPTAGRGCLDGDGERAHSFT